MCFSVLQLDGIRRLRAFYYRARDSRGRDARTTELAALRRNALHKIHVLLENRRDATRKVV